MSKAETFSRPPLLPLIICSIDFSFLFLMHPKLSPPLPPPPPNPNLLFYKSFKNGIFFPYGWTADKPKKGEINKSLTRFVHLQLLHIRLGSGAVVLPPEVKKLQLDFAFKINNGHRGARYVSLSGEFFCLALSLLTFLSPTPSRLSHSPSTKGSAERKALFEVRLFPLLFLPHLTKIFSLPKGL